MSSFNLLCSAADKWFLSHFRVDCHQKTVQERGIDADYMSSVLQQLPTIGDARSADDIPSIKISFDNRIKSIIEDIDMSPSAYQSMAGETHLLPMCLAQLFWRLIYVIKN